MKRNVFVSVIACSCLIYSCKNNRDAETRETKNTPGKITEIREPLTLIRDSATLELVDFATDQPNEIGIKAAYYKPVELPYQDSVNRKIAGFINAFRSEYEDGSDSSAEMSHEVLAECLRDFRDDYRAEVDAFDYPVMYSMDLRVVVDTTYKAFDIVHTFYYVYSGGAHPNSGNYFTWISHDTGKTIRFRDLTTDTSAFNSIARAYFDRVNDLEPGADLAEAGFWFPGDRFSCNDNFSLEGDKLIFVFNAYEVSSYASGPIVVEIPLAEVRHLLRTDLSKRR